MSPDHHEVDLAAPPQHRVSVAKDQEFLAGLLRPADLDDLDDLDDLAADPVLDHLPSRRSDRDLDRLLGILDGLKSNRKESAQ